MARVKALHMAVGCDLVGSRTSMTDRDSDMIELLHGVRVKSKKTGRVMVIPFDNIKGYEIYPDVEELELPVTAAKKK